jgi:2-polyprenyl-3-methyl-5-hydroxy-6-metoxy-1,4-benzoquinol methylase
MKDNNEPSIVNNSYRYDERYLNWKDWQEKDFGLISKDEEAYFNSEVKRTGLDLKKSLDVLEIGFGQGSFMSFARNNGWNIEGTEVNSKLIQQSLNNGFKVYEGTNLENLPDSNYDLIVAFDVLEHIAQSDHENFFISIKKLLKNNGYFLARFPNGDSPLGLIAQNGDVTHLCAIGSGKLEYYASLLEANTIFVGGESEPFRGVNPSMFIYRLITIPIKKITSFLFKLIFMPRKNIAICSMNLVVIYQKISR